jgi:hypothetical protein
LGTDRKTPLSEATPAAPARSQKAQQRSKVARTRLLIVGGIVVAVVAVVAFLATRGGDDGGIIGGIIGDGDDRPVPEVTLKVKSAKPEPTTSEADNQAQQTSATEGGEAIAETLSTMLRAAYVDPDSWDDPGAIDDAFTDAAADRLEADIAVMTLGADAGDTYEFVDPQKATVTVQVLTGSKGEAIRGSAAVSFQALAEHDDGTYTKLVITGSYVLVPDGDTWRIESYRVDRADKPAQAPASPSASASAEASG